MLVVEVDDPDLRTIGDRLFYRGEPFTGETTELLSGITEIEMISYEDGYRDGTCRGWYPNDTQRYSGVFGGGRKVDRWRYWSEEGQLVGDDEFDPAGGLRHRKRWDRLIAELAGDAYLEPQSRPDTVGWRAIIRAGWHLPDPDHVDNWWVEFEWPVLHEHYRRVAAMTVTGLRDGFRIAEPTCRTRAGSRRAATAACTFRRWGCAKPRKSADQGTVQITRHSPARQWPGLA